MPSLLIGAGHPRTQPADALDWAQAWREIELQVAQPVLFVEDAAVPQKGQSQCEGALGTAPSLDSPDSVSGPNRCRPRHRDAAPRESKHGGYLAQRSGKKPCSDPDSAVTTLNEANPPSGFNTQLQPAQSPCMHSDVAQPHQGCQHTCTEGTVTFHRPTGLLHVVPPGRPCALDAVKREANGRHGQLEWGVSGLVDQVSVTPSQGCGSSTHINKRVHAQMHGSVSICVGAPAG
jgi:hypothetical protein